MKKNFFIEIIGWYGVCAILVAYAMVSFSYLDSQTMSYQLLNLTGALAIVIETYHKKDYQPLTINAVWCLIAIFALAVMIW